MNFNPMEYLFKLVMIFVLALLGMIGYYVIQGNIIPITMANTTLWDSSIVSLGKVFLPLSIPVAFIMLMLLLFFKPKMPNFMGNNIDYYEQAVVQKRQRKPKNIQPPTINQ